MCCNDAMYIIHAGCIESHEARGMQIREFNWLFHGVLLLQNTLLHWDCPWNGFFSFWLNSRPLNSKKIKRLSLHVSQVAHQARAYPGFSSLNILGVFLLISGWDASPSQRYSRFGAERHCESHVSCPRTQHNVPGQGPNPDRSIRRERSALTTSPLRLSPSHLTCCDPLL